MLIQETWVQFLIPNDPTWFGAIKAVCHNYLVPQLQSLGATGTVPMWCNYLIPQGLEPVLSDKSSPHIATHLPQLEKSPRSNKDLAQPKINKWTSKSLKRETKHDHLRDTMMLTSYMSWACIQNCCILDLNSDRLY